MSRTQTLREAAGAYRHAERQLAEAKAARDTAIKAAYTEGMTSREIGVAVDLPFQRVAEIVAGDRDAGARRTLHDAMKMVLERAQSGWMPVHEVAREVYENELYRRKDRGVIPPSQIRARAAKYPHLFEGSTDGSNRIRLRPAA